MNSNSQVYSYEAISSSQKIELGNLSGLVVKPEQCLEDEDMTYATPLFVILEQDEESDDTMTYKTPPPLCQQQTIHLQSVLM